ncbi:MAG TPA: CYTH and CHAD domain-containing protein [Mycobacteriales bacterium]|nr:CYTH and CHAD domain-containing protein [Mycobacteriales bacterium]
MREFEIKLSVPADFVVPDLADPRLGVAAAEVLEPVRLSATYFDTVDLRLARHGVTLRRRTGGSDAGWHLKLPEVGGAPEAREEIQLGDDGSGTIPDQLLDLTAAYVRGRPLEVVATLDTDRRPTALQDAAGATLAELTDDTVTVSGGDQDGLVFREIEVEARSGSDKQVRRIGKRLLAGGAAPSRASSKLVQALGAPAAAAPDVLAPTRLGARAPAADAVAGSLRGNLARIVGYDPLARLGRPDAVHQMRVGVRRMRSTLRTYAPVLEPDWAGRIDAELSWLADELGGVREAEVFLDRIHRRIESMPPDDVDAAARRQLLSVLRADLRRGQARLSSSLRSTRYVSLLDQLVDAARAPQVLTGAEKPARKAVPALVQRSWRKLARGADALGTDSPEEEFHRVRKLAKRARYAAEDARAVAGDEAQTLAGEIERVQTVLGEHQDAAHAIEQLTAILDRPRLGVRTSFLIGAIVGTERALMAKTRGDFAGLWQRARRPRHRRWLKR